MGDITIINPTVNFVKKYTSEKGSLLFPTLGGAGFDCPTIPSIFKLNATCKSEPDFYPLQLNTILSMYNSGDWQLLNYDAGFAGNSGTIESIYKSGSDLLVYGVLTFATVNEFNQVRTFRFDENANITYENVITDFGAGTFPLSGPEIGCYLGGDINNPIVSCLSEMNGINKYVNCVIDSVGNFNSYNGIDKDLLDINDLFISEVKGSVGRQNIAGIDYFYTTATNSLTDFEYPAVFMTAHSSYTDPIDTSIILLDLKIDGFLDEDFIWSNTPIGIFNGKIYFSGFGADENTLFDYLIGFDLNNYSADVYVVYNNVEFSNLAVDNQGNLIGLMADENFDNYYNGIYSIIGTNNTKILTPISLPCANPCIPMLRQKG